MKIEHRSIIDRARSMGLWPSELAHELRLTAEQGALGGVHLQLRP